MTKLTTKAFAVLSTLDVYKEAQSKAKEKMVRRSTTVQYSPMEARVPMVKEGRVQGTLHMKQRIKTQHEELGIQAVILKQEMEERAYLQWVEAHSTRREIEQNWEKQFSQSTMKEAEGQLKELLSSMDDMVYQTVVGHGRIVKMPTPMVTWVDETYPKQGK